MAFSINTNNASMAALASLRSTNAQLTSTENQVSTGKKINSASDDPAVYAISQSMNAQVSALSGISSGLQFTAQVLATASTQASSTSNLLSSLSTTVAEGGTSGMDANTLNQSINAILKQIDANANGATFKGVNLLSGAVGNGVTSTSVSATQDLNGDSVSLGGFNVTSSGLGLSGLTVNQAGVSLAVGSQNPILTDVSSGGNNAATLTLMSGPATGTAASPVTSYSFILDQNGSAATANSGTQVATEIAGALGSPSDATVSASANGTISISGSGASKTTDANGDTVYTVASNGDSVTVGKDASGNATYTVSTARDANGNTTTQSVIVDVNTSTANATSQTNEKGTDQINLLTTAMQNAGFGVSKDASGNLTVSGNNIDATGTNTLTVGGASSTSISGTEVTGVDVATATVNAAIAKMNTISSALGSATNLVTGLQSTASNLSDALTTGAGALTDADLSAESAKLTSLQTKQSLAIQALSIANSQSQSLLSLFR